MKRLFQTDAGWSSFILRWLLSVVIFPHGAQKLLGWFVGLGFAGSMSFFADNGMPWIIGLLVIIAEFLGALGLILGFLSRVAAFGVGCVMVGAIQMVHWEQGFFMNWSGNQGGEGFEYHLLVLGICAGLMINGSGRWSLDRSITKGLAQ